MIPLHDLALFAAAALVMVLTPGPNMIYLLSRSICQGRAAGVVSLFGVIAGFVVHMLAAAVGLSAIVMAVPFAFEALKWAGAMYLLWLGWQALPLVLAVAAVTGLVFALAARRRPAPHIAFGPWLALGIWIGWIVR